jgi:UDP-N-acetylglucosamine transferase subunit ALG13
MIFCTIGTQMPFDRFVRVVDSIAPQLHEEVIVQTLKGTYIQKKCEGC